MRGGGRHQRKKKTEKERRNKRERERERERGRKEGRVREEGRERGWKKMNYEKQVLIPLLLVNLQLILYLHFTTHTHTHIITTLFLVSNCVCVSLSPFTYYIALCAQNHSGWLKPAAASRREDKRRQEKILGHNKHLSLSLSLSLFQAGI
jgi:hypothetical protein